MQTDRCERCAFYQAVPTEVNGNVPRQGDCYVRPPRMVPVQVAGAMRQPMMGFQGIRPRVLAADRACEFFLVPRDSAAENLNETLSVAHGQ